VWREAEGGSAKDGAKKLGLDSSKLPVGDAVSGNSIDPGVVPKGGRVSHGLL